MKLSELEKLLADLRQKHGDIDVVYQTLSHQWSPEPEARRYDRAAIKPNTPAQYVLLNAPLRTG